ncbi:hypothetical protein K9F62_16450 [Desulfovibrio sp. JY]|nr:hypothetical protein K9F62_16450 [Desulfovibrio sp. JY]
MSAVVTCLPGLGCRHYLLGRCLYEEHVNPGLDQGFRCRVLTRLGRAFDDFLVRAEAMGLTEEQAGRVWRSRFPETLTREGSCRDYLPGDTTSFPDCANAAGELCLLALPACPGRCRRFFKRQAP